MNVLSVCNHKGGTGKTTTAIHVAAALGLSGRRVLVIDLDPQGFLTRTMGIGEPPAEESVAAFFTPDADLRDIGTREVGGFELIPSSSTLTRRLRDLNKPTDVLWVREVLEDADLHYDLVLFDTAAAVTVFSLNALVASEHVLIPVVPEYQSVVGSEQTYQTTQLVENNLNPLLDTRMFLLTQVDGRMRTHKTYQEYIREKYGHEVLDTVIRTSVTLAESEEDGTTVFDHDPRSRGALDYANSADELLRRIHEASEMRNAERRKASSSGSDYDLDAVPGPGDVAHSS